MQAFALYALLIGVVPSAAAPQPIRPVTADGAESDLSGALRAGDIVELYIISPGISYPAAPTPQTIRSDGCRYIIRRAHHRGDSPQWRELAELLAGIEFTAAPSARRRQVRLGLVIGDSRGTIREIYADSLAYPPGKVFGFDQRRQVHISARFSAALFEFARAHPELAQGPPERCPSLDVDRPSDH
jgi:hypothetical protein